MAYVGHKARPCNNVDELIKYVVVAATEFLKVFTIDWFRRKVTQFLFKEPVVPERLWRMKMEVLIEPNQGLKYLGNKICDCQEFLYL